MDPVTAVAVFGAIGAFFTWANSPEGQLITADIRAANKAFNADVAKLISSMAAHAPMAPDPTAAPAK